MRRSVGRVVGASEKSNNRHRRLVRAYRERPCNCRAAAKAQGAPASLGGRERWTKIPLPTSCAATLAELMGCARDLDREGIGERHFPETVEAARGAGVTGVEVGAKGNQVVIRAQASQSRDPFCRFPVEHPRIGQTRQCEYRRITLRADVLIG